MAETSVLLEWHCVLLCCLCYSLTDVSTKVKELIFLKIFPGTLEKMKREIRRIIQITSAASLAAGSVIFLQKNDWEVSTVGAVRFGRAALAVGHIYNLYVLIGLSF